ncbi:MAG: hypothetical protein MUE56_09715 [Ignavibacteria bacterium]|jgi:hypothetical protein|nr:hypothetical protein [Ignavibacteria bacterium]
MNNEEIKNRFINLRLNSVPLRRIAEQLNISLPTAARWNKKFSEEISNSKSQKEYIINEKINTKIDEYLNLFEKYFKVIEKELDHYSEFPMAFDVALENSLKLFNTIRQLIAMKKTFSSLASKDDLKTAFINSPDTDNKNDNLVPPIN